MVRLGFIGCGTHATANLYPCLRFADVRLIAVCDPVDDRREHCARAFGAERAYTDHRKLLQEESLDAVMVCGPPDMHLEVAREAIERGRHVFIEKPPAPDAAGARELRDLAAAKGVIGMVGFMKRFAQKVRLAEEIAGRPGFGERRHLLLRYSHGARLDRRRTLTLMTIHPIDLVRHFMGEVRRAQVCFDPVGAGWNLSVTFDCDRGPAQLVSLACNPGAKERLELTGSGGEMIVVDELSTLSHYVTGASIWAPPVATRYENNFPLQTFDNLSLEIQGYVGEVRAFVEAVKTGTPPAIATLDDAVRAMEISEAMESIEWGTVELPRA